LPAIVLVLGEHSDFHTFKRNYQTTYPKLKVIKSLLMKQKGLPECKFSLVYLICIHRQIAPSWGSRKSSELKWLSLPFGFFTA
jgi:hypothetical protein